MVRTGCATVRWNPLYQSVILERPQMRWAGFSENQKGKSHFLLELGSTLHETLFKIWFPGDP
jgi:hypothetical protein